MQPDNTTEDTQQTVQERDRHITSYPYTAENAYNDKAKEESVIVPTATFEKIKQFMEQMDKHDKAAFQELFSKDEIRALSLNTAGVETTLLDNVYAKTLEPCDDFINVPVYADKELSIRPMPLRADVGKVTGPAAIARFTSLLGIGEVVQIPLWHSGFWLTVKPPKDNEMIALESALANNQITLGRETNTLVYSNYSVVFNRIVTDFILDHIVGSTLKLDPNEDIRNYIQVQDLNIMILGLIMSMYPDGYNVTRACINSVEIDDSNKPKCSFIVNGKLDPKKLLWLNRKDLSQSMLVHMAKRTPNSMSVDEVTEYKLSISRLKDKDVVLKAGNGKDVKLKLKSPTLLDYVSNGELWIQNVISKTEAIFSDADSTEARNSKVTTVLASVILGIYNVYISEIETDGHVVDDRETIDAILDTISADKGLIENYMDTVKDFISMAAVAIVATPDYVCPVCKEAQTDETVKSNFNYLIPLNVLDGFFDLSALRISKIAKRLSM